MEPKPSTAGASLSALSNAINSAAPADSPFTTTRNQTYAPPSLGHIVPPSLPPQQPTPPPEPGMQAPVGYTPAAPQQSMYTPPAPSYTNPQNDMHPVQTYDSVQRRSRLMPVIISIFAFILLLVTGLLYLYGSSVVNNQQHSDTYTTPPTGAALQQVVPTNGFQVTESGATEPNFDSQLDQQSGQAAPATTSYPSAPSGVNTDTANMFAE
jgi:hypothetical protein